MNWQPIETAPKDGTRVLLAKAGKSYVTMGRWVERFSEEHFVDGKHGWFNDATQSRYWNPTHWMPLPSFPDAEVRVDDDPHRAQGTDNGFLNPTSPPSTGGDQ